MDYWQECISEAFDEAKIIATQAQIDMVAEWVEGASENESQARGWDCIPHPLESENERLKDELAKERGKETCKHCKGTGDDVSYGPSHTAVSQCSYCRGEGRC